MVDKYDLDPDVIAITRKQGTSQIPMPGKSRMSGKNPQLQPDEEYNYEQDPDLAAIIQHKTLPPQNTVEESSGLLPSWLNTGVQTGMGVLSGMVTPIIGGAYGLAKSIPEAISTGQAPQPIAQKYAEQFIKQHPGYTVTDPQAQANLEAVQQAFEASKLPPVMPEGLQMNKGGAKPKEIVMATKANLPKISIQKSGAEAQLANQFGQRIEPQMNVTQTPQSVGINQLSNVKKLLNYNL